MMGRPRPLVAPWRALGRLAVVLALVSSGFAAEPRAVIEGNLRVPTGGTVFLSGMKSVSDRPLKWKLVSGDGLLVTLTNDQTGMRGAFAVIFGAADGQYRVKLVAIGTIEGGDLDADAHEVEVVVGGGIPPVPPIPPGPDPPPPPPPPPVPTPGLLRVLILYESSQLAAIPRGQLAAMQSTVIRQYLSAHCLKGAKGTPEWRIWDKDVDPSAESIAWQETMKRRTGSTLPWIHITNGVNSFDGPLPATEAEMMTLLKKYGGE